MKLFALPDVSIAHGDGIYRHPPANMILAAAVMIALVSAALYTKLPTRGIAYVSTALLIMLLLGMRRVIVARLQPSNWLAVVNPEGILLHFRSYLNFHFPDDVSTVAFVPYADISSARVVKQKWRERHSDSTIWRSRTLVELELTNEDVALKNAVDIERQRGAPIHEQWFGNSTTRYGSYPVRVEGRRIQIEWTARPGAPAFVQALGDHGVTILDKIVVDFTKQADKAAQETLLLQLVESGRTIQAVNCARSIYKCDLTDARKLVEELRTTPGKN